MEREVKTIYRDDVARPTALATPCSLLAALALSAAIVASYAGGVWLLVRFHLIVP